MAEGCEPSSNTEAGSGLAVPQGRASLLPFAAAAFLVAAVAFATLPLLVLGYPFTHSYGFNLAWASQFTELIWAGVPYPRWLPRAFEGLGAPSFIFYAPLPFYLMALLDLVTFRQLSTEVLVAACSAMLLVASALAMRHWLLHFVDAPRAAIGAAIYVLAPYHIFDVHVRGALGEVAAYAILPMLACALEDTFRTPRKSWHSLGFWTALLILSHLPSALGVGLLYVPLRMLTLLVFPGASGNEKINFVLYAVLGALLGLSLSFFYWGPALSLLDIASFHYGDTGYFDPRNWVFLNWRAWPEPRVVTILLLLASALAAICGVGLIRFTETRVWAGLSWSLSGLLIFLAMAGAIPMMWHQSSPLHRIQFPWRLLLIAEFLAISVCMSLSAQRMSRLRNLTFIVPLIIVILVSALASAFAFRFYNARNGNAFREEQHLALERGFEATEYLPRGHPLRYSGGNISHDRFREIGRAYSPSQPAWSEPSDAARISIQPGRAGDMTIRVEAERPARIVLRRFYYPLWTIEADGHSTTSPPLIPHGEDRLLAFDVRPGIGTYSLVWSPPTIIPASLVVSGLSLIALLWMLVIRSRSPTRAT